jgi:hypothetical protein
VVVAVEVEVELTGDSSTDDDDGGANGRIHEWMCEKRIEEYKVCCCLCLWFIFWHELNFIAGVGLYSFFLGALLFYFIFDIKGVLFFNHYL